MKIKIENINFHFFHHVNDFGDQTPGFQFWWPDSWIPILVTRPLGSNFGDQIPGFQFWSPDPWVPILVIRLLLLIFVHFTPNLVHVRTLFSVITEIWKYPSTQQAPQLSDKLTWISAFTKITLTLWHEETEQYLAQELLSKENKIKPVRKNNVVWASLFCEWLSFY